MARVPEIIGSSSKEEGGGGTQVVHGRSKAAAPGGEKP